MPLVCRAAIAYACGLATAAAAPNSALAAAGLVAAAVVLLLFGTGRIRESSTPLALTVLYVAGVVHMQDAATTDRKCARTVDGAPSLRVVIHDALDDRGRGRAHAFLPGTRCGFPARISAAGGSARPGDVVDIAGRVTVLRRWGRLSVRIDNATLSAPLAREWLPRIRAAANAMIVRRFDRDSPLVLALVAAETSAIDREVRDRFADSGLIHILSVSGLHVAIIAAAVQLAFTLVGFRPQPALLCGAAFAVTYVLLLGVPPPAVRSATMLSMSVLGRLMQRPASHWTGLAVGGSIPLLIDPRTIANAGWQLSMAGMVGLVVAGTVRRRWMEHKLGAVPAAIAESVLASSAATLTTAPLVAWHFGRLSVAGLLSNLFGGPLVGVLQPALFVALLLEPIPPAAAFVADASRPLLRALDQVAARIAALPGAAFDVQPTLAAALLTGVLILGLTIASEARHPARPLMAAALAAALLAWLPALPPSGSGFTELHVLDVGQGDALAIRTPRGRWMLVDAGASWPGGDEGSRTVVPYLMRRGARVSTFVLSHPDADHVGGAAAVMQRLRPGEFWDGAYVSPSAPYRDALRVARDQGVHWRRVAAGDSTVMDGVVVTVISPDPEWLATGPSSNDASVVLRIRFGSVRFLLVGDAESGQEARMVARDPELLDAEVLKLGHHGSRTSTTATFLDAVDPLLAVVSVGAANRFGHPADEVVARLDSRDIPLWRTDRFGSIVLRTDGRHITLLADDDRWEFGPF